MLKLKQIKKDYATGDFIQHALKKLVYLLEKMNLSQYLVQVVLAKRHF